MNRTRNSNRTLAGALQTSLIKQLGKRQRQTPKKPLPTIVERKSASAAPERLTQSKYVGAKAAYQHLGISKATFFRLRGNGHFPPSPVTGRYHLDDLDREARGIRGR
jgi:hypothetical protein